MHTCTLPAKVRVEINSIEKANCWIRSIVQLGLLWNLEEDPHETLFAKFVTAEDVDVLESQRDAVLEIVDDWGEFDDVMDFAMSIPEAA